MEKTTKLNPEQIKARDKVINEKLSLMRRRDLVEACIKRGMEFKEIVEASNHSLANFFYKNFEKEVFGDARLNEFDAWVEEILMKNGHMKGEPMLNPIFRLGFSPMTDGEIKHEPKAIPYKKEVVEKVKRMVNEDTGIVSGTKKDLTYQLTQKGKSLEYIIKKVTEKFPDAKEKSITIWHKRCLKGE